jgi:6-phosphofructokinase 1
MSGMATGAEKVYLHEEGITLRDLQTDLEYMVEGFKHGKRLGLLIRNEYANPIYTTAFLNALFEEEGANFFDVRQAILGHLQQGGNPSPFDRIQATMLASRCVDYLIDQAEKSSNEASFIGFQGGKLVFHKMEDFMRMVDYEHQRPKEQWWLGLRQIAKILAGPNPDRHPA